MLPITIIKKQKILIVGAGNACEIKLKVLKNHQCDITVVSKEFLYDLDENITKIKASFDELQMSFFDKFDLIYIAIKLDDETIVKELAKTKMINVLSNPKLSTFIHPCTRSDGDVLVSINSIDKPNPKRICKIAQDLISYLKEYNRLLEKLKK